MPENLYIIGILNIDESTFPISKKVLDRTNIIEITKTSFFVVCNLYLLIWLFTCTVIYSIVYCKMRGKVKVTAGISIEEFTNKILKKN